MFSEKRALARARKYRRKGLDGTTRRLYEVLRTEGLEGRTLLEVGGGIGDLQIELLKAGLARAVSVELTPTYEAAAATLLRETGLEDRVERRVIDFAEAGAEVAPADIVVLNRVVCCYPDMPRLAGAAADHARQVLVLSFPRESWWTRLTLALGNLLFRAVRLQFHVFIHRPARILQTAEEHGLATALDSRGIFWQVAAFRRPA